MSPLVRTTQLTNSNLATVNAASVPELASSSIKSLGPGSYDISTISGNRQCFSKRGILDMRALRFQETASADVPGAGTYGDDGDPHKYKEKMELLHKSASTIGLLNNGGDGVRSLPASCCRIGPGTYTLINFMDDFVRKSTGKRGFYDINTGPRDKPTISENPDLGTYELKSFTDELNHPAKRHVGKFRRVADPFSHRRLNPLSENHNHSEESHEVGPATYNPPFIAQKSTSFNRKQVPFHSKASRYAQSLFTSTRNPVGPGRYDAERYDDSRCVWGSMSAFDSQTPARPDQNYNLRLGERLNPTNIPLRKRIIISHHSTEGNTCLKMTSLRTQERNVPLLA
ncbi:unnamed protein product [Calicophoron daubneyi]|uniref:Uncharacterized protein n=1 Tax=Calicophoron daubneyi TaxID=300641 RepID=A0AAV2TQH8_CALDB